MAADDYRPGEAAERILSANANTLLIAQIETAVGLEHVEEIAAVEGIDVLWIGQNDLTNFLGIPGTADHPKYQDAVRRVLEATRRQGKAAGFLVMDVPQGHALLQQGFRMLAFRGDIWLDQRALGAGRAA